MPDGLFAYRMISYTITEDDDDDDAEELVGTLYSGKPSIPSYYHHDRR